MVGFPRFAREHSPCPLTGVGGFLKKWWHILKGGGTLLHLRVALASQLLRVGILVGALTSNAFTIRRWKLIWAAEIISSFSLVLVQDPDVIISTGTKLDESLKNAEFLPTGYQGTARRDRGGGGGGGGGGVLLTQLGHLSIMVSTKWYLGCFIDHQAVTSATLSNLKPPSNKLFQNLRITQHNLYTRRGF